MSQPRDVPIMRDELTRHMDTPQGREMYRLLGRTHGWAGIPAGSIAGAIDSASDSVHEMELGTLRVAELFHVNNDMTDLAMAAGLSLPGFRMEREDLPAEAGLIVFAKPIAATVLADAIDGSETYTTAALWRVVHAQMLSVMFYTSRELNKWHGPDAARSGLPVLVHDNECFMGLGVDYDPTDGSIVADWGRTLIASWLLMQQPGVAQRSPYKYSQMDRAWLKRRRIKPGAVTVVKLRYAPSDGHGSAEGSSREYHHRWFVRGHWRRQRYASRNGHIPIWISPHIKGPEGAPLRTGLKVNAWVR